MAETRSLALPRPPEPVDQQFGLRSAAPAVRNATLKHAGDIAAPIYQLWKEDSRRCGVSWQSFQTCATRSYSAWSQCVEGALPWREAVLFLLNELNIELGLAMTLSEEAGGS